MSSTAKNNGTNVGAEGGFMSKMDHFLYSGDKKHVAAGIAVLTVIFGIPWYFMNQESKHQSHQDYLGKADKAQSERLSSGSSSAK
ncbi:uncharacterized protein LOC115987691 [Quercus lobata]|uniref:uncharacterized protein LOC115987691 n=1 Tax=Quercus lobata TaxID=97700 RepID=UPI001245AA1F|nr:uncharacterized protein LOC115987691 [Quercus lobata]